MARGGAREERTRNLVSCETRGDTGRFLTVPNVDIYDQNLAQGVVSYFFGLDRRLPCK